MVEYTKPIPTVGPDTKAFWESCKKHELSVPRCNTCGLFFYPPQACCPRDLSKDVVLSKVSGRGEIYSMSVIHQNKSKGFQDEVPYIIAYVLLEDANVKMFSNVVDVADPYTVKIGTKVKASFRDINDEISIPVFVVCED